MSEINPQSQQGYQIGEAAKRSGVSAANIRFYEKERLIGRRGMGAGSYRMYSDDDVHQLRFIRLLRSLDMSLNEMRSLLSLDLRKKNDCQTARDTLDAHMGHVRERIAELRKLDKQLTELRARCDGTSNNCHLIEALHQSADQLTEPTRRKRMAQHL